MAAVIGGYERSFRFCCGCHVKGGSYFIGAFQVFVLNLTAVLSLFDTLWPLQLTADYLGILWCLFGIVIGILLIVGVKFGYKDLLIPEMVYLVLEVCHTGVLATYAIIKLVIEGKEEDSAMICKVVFAVLLAVLMIWMALNAWFCALVCRTYEFLDLCHDQGESFYPWRYLTLSGRRQSLNDNGAKGNRGGPQMNGDVGGINYSGNVTHVTVVPSSHYAQPAGGNQSQLYPKLDVKSGGISSSNV